MSISLYGRSNSLNVFKVLWLLDELKLPYQRIDAGGKFELNKENPEYLKLNPNGLVPTLDDHGFLLWESNSILRYVARKYQKAAAMQLISDDLQTQALQEQWMDWVHYSLSACMNPLFIQLIRTPKENQNHELIETSRKTAISLWTLLNNHLEGRNYVVGETMSVGDIPLACYAYRWFNLNIERPSLPNLERYYKQFTTRESYQQHVMIPLT